MRLKVIVDNNTMIDTYYWGAPGVSYFIEDEGSRFLFDMGYSDLVLHNLKAMGINAESINTIDYLKNNQITALYPCHCTSFAVKAAIHSEILIHDVGLGLELNW